MPTSYIKKLSKLNHTTNKVIEKFWSQAKEIAKSYNKGKNWGLITKIFQDKLKGNGYKIKGYTYKGNLIIADTKREAITTLVRGNYL